MNQAKVMENAEISISDCSTKAVYYLAVSKQEKTHIHMIIHNHTMLCPCSSDDGHTLGLFALPINAKPIIFATKPLVARVLMHGFTWQTV